MMNKQKGNMYHWVSHTWNPIKGECPHDCSYCFMKRFKVGKLRLDNKSLSDNLGNGNFIFVGSSVDMFADEIPDKWILKTLEHCRKFLDNNYLFQTKNPERFFDFLDNFPKKTIFGTTIETNRDTWDLSKAPNTFTRKEAMNVMKFISNKRTMISVEPITDFDLDVMIKWMEELQPIFVSIGADSKNNNLPEPSPEKVKALIKELRKFTDVKVKDNLNRLLK